MPSVWWWRSTKGWQRYLGEAVVSSPFNRLPPPVSGVPPLTLPAPLFYALSWAIAELGRIQDAALVTERRRLVPYGERERQRPQRCQRLHERFDVLKGERTAGLGGSPHFTRREPEQTSYMRTQQPVLGQ